MLALPLFRLSPLLLALAAGAACAVPPGADAVYKQERAACMAAGSTQDRNACLKDAGAARDEARHRRLDNGETPAQLLRNALERCKRVADDDRAACERMVRGEGQRSGSVAEGGVVTQITTRVEPTPAPQR